MHVYKLYNKENELLYIGKSSNIDNRIKQHIADKFRISWKSNIKKIMISNAISEIDTELYETYYINKLKPLHNSSKVYNEIPSFELEDLDFVEYKVKINKKDISNIPDDLLGKYLKLYLIYDNNKEITFNNIKNTLNIKKRTTYTIIKNLIEYDMIVKNNKNYILNYVI